MMKKSCDSCTASKVKCVGGCPCNRCTKKTIPCIFSPRKKRAQVKGRKSTKSGNVENEFQDYLEPWEKRCWTVFFTLFKNYSDNSASFYFGVQLRKLRNRLEAGNKNSKLLQRLQSWLSSINLDMKEVDRSMFDHKASLDKIQRNLLGKCKGTVEDNNKFSAQEAIYPTDGVPYVKMSIPFLKCLEPDPESLTISCNEAFTDVFGLTASDFHQQFKKSYGGYLPWGADILSRILHRSDDLLAFVQIIAIKYNNFERPKRPFVRSTPSTHVFKVNLADGTKKDAYIKCLHRENVFDVMSCRSPYKVEMIQEVFLEISIPDMHPPKEVSVLRPCESFEMWDRPSKRPKREGSEIDFSGISESISSSGENQDDWFDNLLTWVSGPP
eukprot:maker-scaffold_6-snap-gene-17.25-mRNA-1 protein AED:0.19 eAED:0.19 QI:81/1/1/1/0.25/0.2/5/265/382